nr:metalloregulator ArsR/SmtB family transcription factor [Kribbella sandramycini]
MWSAVGDVSRLRILDLLVENGEVTASWLSGQVPISRQAVVKHLATLEHVRLISRRKQGREVLCRIDDARLEQAAQAMAARAAGWNRRLRAIKRLAEAIHADEQRASERS